MQEPVRRQRGETRDVVADLRDLLSPEPLGIAGADLAGPRWTRSRAAGSRCARCRRRIRSGEPVLVGGDATRFCGLCGRRHWALRWEDPPAD